MMNYYYYELLMNKTIKDKKDQPDNKARVKRTLHPKIKIVLFIHVLV